MRGKKSATMKTGADEFRFECTCGSAIKFAGAAIKNRRVWICPGCGVAWNLGTNKVVRDSSEKKSKREEDEKSSNGQYLTHVEDQ